MNEALPGLEFALQQEDPERLRKLNVDRTPEPVAFQVLAGLAVERVEHIGRAPRILDVGCGEGSWGVGARRLWPDAHLMGIEPRDEAIPHAARNYDRVVHGFFPGEMPETQKFDLVIGNPPFSYKPPGKRKINLFPGFIRAALKLLRTGGTLCFYATNDLGQRGLKTRELFDEHPPAIQLRVAGDVGHRGPKREGVKGSGEQDSRCYSGWVWVADGMGGTISPADGWRARNLPELPRCDRKWVRIPGT